MERDSGEEWSSKSNFSSTSRILVYSSNSLVLLVKSYTKYLLLYNQIYHILINTINAANDIPALRLTPIHMVEFILPRGLF